MSASKCNSDLQHDSVTQCVCACMCVNVCVCMCPILDVPHSYPEGRRWRSSVLSGGGSRGVVMLVFFPVAPFHLPDTSYK